MPTEQQDPRVRQTGEIITPGYRGPDRRTHDQAQQDAEIYQTVISNAAGDVILDVRTNARRRREDDMTVNLLKCLDISDLSIEDFDD
jgi:hypothetical protein